MYHYFTTNASVEKTGNTESQKFPEQNFIPPLNVLETPTQVKYIYTIPGVKAEDVSIELAEDNISISGISNLGHKSNDYRFIHQEISTGTYTRITPLLGGIDKESSEAHISDGILEVTFPKVTREKKNNPKEDLPDYGM